MESSKQNQEENEDQDSSSSSTGCVTRKLEKWI